MIATIHTESRYSGAKDIGAYSLLITWTGGRITVSGLLSSVRSNEQCELRALILALRELSKSSLANLTRLSINVKYAESSIQLVSCEDFIKVKEQWPGVVVKFAKVTISHEVGRETVNKILKQHH